MVDITLTQEQIDSLGLSPDVIEELATANPLTKKTLTRKIISKFKDSLMNEARLTDDPVKREKLQNLIDETVKAARKAIKDSVKEGGADVRSAQSGFNKLLKPLTDLNIYADGQRLDEQYLYNTEITEDIEIRNPKTELLTDDKFKTYIQSIISGESVAPEAFKTNVRKIISKLEKIGKPKEYKAIKDFPVQDFLGAIDVSKASKRIEVYEYWNKIGKKYEQFEEDLTTFFFEAKNADWGEEVKALFEKLFRQVANTNLEYIVSFDAVPKEFQSAHHRFFNIVSHRMGVDGMLRGRDSPDYTEDDAIVPSDVNSQLLVELEQSLGQTSGEIGAEEMADPKEWEENLTDDIKWEGDLDMIKGGADPLLIYEYNRGEKLISINVKGERELLAMLKNMVEKLDEGQGVTLETERDIEEWLEQIADTKIINESALENMALPISCLLNTEFNEMYSQKGFSSIHEKKDISIDNLDLIKDFFEDLYRLLSGDEFIAEVEARSTQGSRRGSVMESREARGTSMEGLTGGAQIPISMNQKGTLRGQLTKFKTSLQNMMDSAIDYYFDPLYSGMLPIEIPRFGSSIGSKVIQTLSLDLGLDSVMSASYDTLFEGSVEEVDVGDLKAISNFLSNVFMPEIEIGDELITEGEFCARALTAIFGREEANNNYCAALIHHYMVETEDLTEENENFNGKTIAVRADEFHEDFTNRRAFPVFALPHWLDMNQGILTKKSPAMKTQYNRLKAIFETQQTDLPVLLHKLLKAHDVIRQQLGKPVIIGHIPINDYGINKMVDMLQEKENLDLTNYEVEQIIKAVDSHQNISKEFGISSEQVYGIKASFR